MEEMTAQADEVAALETHATVVRRRTYNRHQFLALWPMLAKAFGLKEKPEPFWDPVLLIDNDIEIDEVNDHILSVTIPVTVYLKDEERVAVLAAIEEASRA
jgi:hypothetical protein